jgi:hypothetical protein
MEYLGNNKYLKHIRDGGDMITHNFLVLIMHRKWVDELQEHLNNTEGAKLVADGIFGLMTMSILDKAIHKDPRYLNKFVEEMVGVQTTSDPIESLRQPLMNFLADAEGTVVHMNDKTESKFTTPYGVYAKVFPKSKPVLYVYSLFKKYNLNPNSKRDIVKINYRLTTEEKLKIQDLCWEFYKEHFMHKGILILLNEMTSISYLSIAINGGKRRGNKAIQSAIGVKVDGKIGKQTLTRLHSVVETTDMKNINFGMLEYMILFYARLIHKHKKFFRYRNGWYNRLYATSCNLFKKKYKKIPL